MARIYGTSLSDTLEGTNFDDRLYGRGGDDIIFTGAGNDLVKAGRGDDTVVIGNGTNKIYGGSGSDTFQFEADAQGTTTLYDWQGGSDNIDLSDLGITSLSELTISTSGSWTTISAGDLTIRLDDSSLNSSDFTFANSTPDPVDPVDPLPANGTLYDFDNMLSWSIPEFSSRTGDFVAEFNGFSGWNESFVSTTAPDANGFISPTYDGYFGDPFARVTVSANTDVMASDTFDFESFETRDADGFTLIAFNDGVETGRQSFDGVSSGEWTTVHADDAIFDNVDEVQFVGLHSMDDMLIIA